VSRKAGRATPASPGSYGKHFLSNEPAQHLKSDVARYRTAYLGFVKELRQTQPDCGEMLAAIQRACLCRSALQGAEGDQEADQARGRATGGLTSILRSAAASCGILQNLFENIGCASLPRGN